MLEVKVENGAGIDVGKKFLAVCVLTGPVDRKPVEEARRFGHEREGTGTITGMAGGEEMHGSCDGKHWILLETGVQHFRRKPEDRFGESRTGQGAPRQEDRSERQPLAGEFAAAWVG